MKNKTGLAALVVASLALLSSLAGFAPAAGFIITSSQQIKPGVILTTDIHKNAVTAGDIRASAVHSSDIQESAVTSGDIGAGQVEPQDVTAPAPDQITEPGGGEQVGSTYEPVDTAGIYNKEDPTSVLEVDWTGTAGTGFSPCIFQLRINGQPPAGGGGEAFVANGSTIGVSDSALFAGVPEGLVTVEVWAKATISSNIEYPCTVGPPETTPQTFAVSEQVV